MCTALLFKQPIPQNPSSGFQSDKIGPSGFDRSSKSQATHESSKGDGDSFLTTLKQVAQDRRPNEHSQHPGEAQSSETTVSVEGSEIGETSDHATAQNERDAEPDQMASDWNFTAINQVLADMGLFDAIGGSHFKNMVDVNSADGNQLAALKTLIGRLQQNQFGPSTDLEAGLKHLQQFIANALAGKVPLSLDGNSGQALSPNLVTEPAQINQSLNGLPPGLSGQNGNSVVLPPSENRSQGDPAKSTSDTRLLVAENQQHSKAANAIERPAADTPKIREVLGLLPDPGTSNRTEVPSRMAPTSVKGQQTGTENSRDSRFLKPSASSGMNPAAAQVSESQIQRITGEEPLSKVFQETQLVKAGVVKVESGTTEDTVGKFIKTEAGTNDNGLLNPLGQNPEKIAESVSLTKEPAAGQDRLRNSTLDQIVRKAAIHLKNGQHEARIDLKPDFLGHIRMQVLAENQQVTVKILAQHGFVKDMIESNVHQLKADLQQQGLEVDKLEVSVSRDPDDSGNLREKLAQSRAKQRSSDHPNEDRPTEEPQKGTRQPLRTASGPKSVDYFA